jgi:hypothetical protein
VTIITTCLAAPAAFTGPNRLSCAVPARQAYLATPHRAIAAWAEALVVRVSDPDLTYLHAQQPSLLTQAGQAHLPVVHNAAAPLPALPGETIIADFNPWHPAERIDLRQIAEATDFATLELGQDDLGTVIGLPDGGILKLPGVAPEALAADHFLFAGQSDEPVYTVRPGTPGGLIQGLIEAAPNGAVIRFTAGRFAIDEPLLIARGDISLIGAGIDRTQFVLATQDGLQASLFDIACDEDEPTAIRLSAGFDRGSDTLFLNEVDAVRPGDVVRIEQGSSRIWIDQDGAKHVSAGGEPVRMMTARVKKVHGNIVTLDSDAPYDFAGGRATLTIKRMLHRLRLGGFSVTTDLAAANADRLCDVLPTGHGAATLDLRNVAGLELFEISAQNNVSTAFRIRDAFDVSARDLAAIDAHNKGRQGNGYGYHLIDVIRSSFANLSDQGMAAGVVFASASAAPLRRARVRVIEKIITLPAETLHPVAPEPAVPIIPQEAADILAMFRAGSDTLSFGLAG